MQSGIPSSTPPPISNGIQGRHSLDDALDEFLAAMHARDAVRARDVVRAHPQLVTTRIHVTAAMGLAAETARLLADDGARLTARAGDPSVDPLLAVCYSPFHGESAERDAGLLETAQLLLQAGADPNTTDGRHGVPALYAVTGWRSVPSMARLLLASGANPTDGESVFHAAENFHENALELLLDAGADVNATGNWGNTPLYFLLRWYDVAQRPNVGRGVRWLLAHGANPNIPCGDEGETPLHVSARRGQSVEIIQLLLEHGADLHARRGDGRTAWRLARRGGFDAIAETLEAAGARAEPLTDVDRFLAACARGDTDEAIRLGSSALVATLTPGDLLLLPDAAANDRPAVVMALVAAGVPVDTVDGIHATALHYSALHGRSSAVRALLAAGATTEIRDREHDATPLGWACFGADVIRESGGDYPGCVRALLEAHATFVPTKHAVEEAGVRAVLAEFAGVAEPSSAD